LLWALDVHGFAQVLGYKSKGNQMVYEILNMGTHIGESSQLYQWKGAWPQTLRMVYWVNLQLWWCGCCGGDGLVQGLQV